MIDLVIPSVEGREADLERCIASYEANTAPGVLSFIVIRDEETVGHAWKKGIEQSDAPYVALTNDDCEIISPTWAGVCCETVDEGFLPCPVVRRPDGSLESCGGDMNSPACLISTVLPDKTGVDFTTIPFMSREQADRIGMLEIHYGADVWVSHRGRQLGYETVVRQDYAFIHHHSNVKRRTAHPGEMVALNEALARG